MLALAAVKQTETTGKKDTIDEALFQHISQGDKQAFCELYEICHSAVFSYAMSLLRNRDDAEDAAQETFLRIRAAAHLYQAQGKPLAWILTITKNICMMQFRRKKRECAMPEELSSSDMGLDDIADLEDRLVLKEALRSLSAEDCSIILLHAVSGLKHREIAELMSLPLSTVLSRYNRGLRKLRRKLEEEQ